MARPLVVPPHLPVAELERRSRGARGPVRRSHRQIVWLPAKGERVAAVAAATGYRPNRVREVAKRWREGGPGARGDRRRGNPGGAPWLDEAGQEARRAAPAAGIGERVGRPVAEARGWEGMRRLGFAPPRPRRREERADPAAPAASKRGASRQPSTR